LSLPAAKSCPQPSPALRGVAVCAALLVWLLGIFAASAELHAALHRDADHQDHSCAITLFSHGTDDTSDHRELVAVLALFSVGAIIAESTRWIGEAPHRLPPGCGPPLC
jgi:hypothetical protein